MNEPNSILSVARDLALKLRSNPDALTILRAAEILETLATLHEQQGVIVRQAMDAVQRARSR